MFSGRDGPTKWNNNVWQMPHVSVRQNNQNGCDSPSHHSEGQQVGNDPTIHTVQKGGSATQICVRGARCEVRCGGRRRQAGAGLPPGWTSWGGRVCWGAAGAANTTSPKPTSCGMGTGCTRRRQTGFQAVREGVNCGWPLPLPLLLPTLFVETFRAGGVSRAGRQRCSTGWMLTPATRRLAWGRGGPHVQSCHAQPTNGKCVGWPEWAKRLGNAVFQTFF